MANLPAVQSTNQYSHIESLAQIRPPYPATLSADWWALRRRMEEIMARDQRRNDVKWTREEIVRSKTATSASLGEEHGTIEYERDGMTREEWLERHFPQAAGGALVHPAERIRLLRNAMRGL